MRIHRKRFLLILGGKKVEVMTYGTGGEYAVWLDGKRVGKVTQMKRGLWRSTSSENVNVVELGPTVERATTSMLYEWQRKKEA